jgi:hypothetical protein
MSWTASNINANLEGYSLYGACILPSNNTLGEVWISGSGYSNPGVYLSTNHGTNFTAKSNGLPSTMVFKLAATPAETFVFAATEVGPYVYNKYADSWFPMSEGVAPDQTYWSVEYNNQMKTARFVTYGRGIWDFRIATPLSFEEKTERLNLTLFPNPTSNYLQVQLENEKSRPTTYQIYNLSGKTVLSGSLNKGQKSIPLFSLSNGVYIIQLKNGFKPLNGSVTIIR